MCKLHVVKFWINAMSLVGVLCSLAITVLTFIMIYTTGWMASNSSGEVPPPEIMDLARSVTIVTLALAALILILSVCGFFTQKLRKVCCVCCYGASTFIMTLLLLAVSLLIVSFQVFSGEQLKSFCNNDYDFEYLPAVGDALNEFRLQVDNVDATYRQTVGTFMCTEACPCVAVDFTKWNTTMERDLSRPRQFGGKYNFKGSYTNFDQCYQDKKVMFSLATQFSNQSDAWQSEKFRLARYFEESMDCAGACESPLFWVFRNVTEGQPPAPCIYKVKEEYDRAVGPIGWVIGGAALSTFFAFLCHHGFYCTREKKV